MKEVFPISLDGQDFSMKNSCPKMFFFREKKKSLDFFFLIYHFLSIVQNELYI